MQVISDTVCKNLMRIQELNKSDRLLQKSMVGNVHQWLVDNSESFLQDFEEMSRHSGIRTIQTSIDPFDGLKSPSAKSAKSATGFMLGGPFHRKNNKSVFTSAAKLSHQPTAMTSFGGSETGRGDNRSVSLMQNSDVKNSEVTSLDMTIVKDTFEKQRQDIMNGLEEEAQNRKGEVNRIHLLKGSQTVKGMHRKMSRRVAFEGNQEDQAEANPYHKLRKQT